MNSYKELSKKFEEQFNKRHFPAHTETLYNAAQYILEVGGKRIRPVCVLMGNELFDEIIPDAFYVGTAIELFHNFTLIHDDIMDKAPLRRGMDTVHAKFGEPTALLAGDVMLIQSYEYLNKIKTDHLHQVLRLFNKMANEVCEGQQLDMDFEKETTVNFEEYVKMISLKTSVLLASSLQMGALLGGAGPGNQHHIYEFGKNLGIAFQIQDDYLDAFGDPAKFGKQLGGDILSNKKTFLMIHALQSSTGKQLEQLNQLINSNPVNKIERVLQIFKDCKADNWALELKNKYLQIALQHLEDIAVLSIRKKPLAELAEYLIKREY